MCNCAKSIYVWRVCATVLQTLELFHAHKNTATTATDELLKTQAPKSAYVKTKPRLNKQHENCPMKAKSIDFKLRYIILTSKHISFIQSLIRFERIIILQIQYIQITQTHAHTHTANRQAARPTQSTTKPLKTMCVTSHDAKQTRNIRIQCRHYAAVYRKLQTANRHTG